MFMIWQLYIISFTYWYDNNDFLRGGSLGYKGQAPWANSYFQNDVTDNEIEKRY